MKKAIGYIRVSTKNQEKGLSLSAQEKTIKNYAKHNNLDLIDLMSEVDSGLKFEREGIMNLLDRAEKHHFDIVLVTVQDRLSRDPEHTGYITITLQLNDVEVIAIEEPKSIDNHVQELQRGILALVAKYEAKRKRYRFEMGQKEALKIGKAIHKPPFGYDSAEDSGKFPIPNKDAEIVKDIFHLRASGKKSLQQIASKYEKSPTFIKRVLENQFYIGKIKHRGIWLDGGHQPIVSNEIFEEAKSIDKRKGSLKVTW